MNLDTLFTELRAEHFSPELPVPRLAWNPRMSSSAGRFSPGYARVFASEPPLIEVASYLRSIPDGHTHVRDTMLHEMIHYYLWWQKKPYGHTPEFHSIMRRTGATRFNPVPKLRPVKYWYECPSCKIAVPARRDLGSVACATCCKRHNQGRFHPRFILLKKSTPPQNAPHKIPESALNEDLFIKTEELISRLQSLKELVKNAVIGA